MSGFVCIFNRDGEPVDQALLEKLTDSLIYRGPHGRGIQINGNIGMGHTLLITTEEHAREKQPFTFDGTTWIVADARVDDRDRLKRELISKGRVGCEQATDVELLLHAYLIWGQHCVDHLLGDFSFVIWDSRTQSLFCARDHIGFKLLYYAEVGQTVILSNELNCIRRHPMVSSELNDLAILDFLVCSYNLDPSTSSFAQINKIPPASLKYFDNRNSYQKKYWTVPYDQQVRYKQPDEYVEHFVELMKLSISDRLRTPVASVLMSGGLDSTIIAALAKTVLSEKYSQFDFHAITSYYNYLIPHNERDFAVRAAEHIGIPIDLICADNFALNVDAKDYVKPEPYHCQPFDYLGAPYKEVTARGGVVLYGDGGDSLLYAATGLEMLASQGLWLTAKDILSFWIEFKERPVFGFGLFKRIKNLLGIPTESIWDDTYTQWINHELEQRYDLYKRWDTFTHGWRVPQGTKRPYAYHSLVGPYWSFLVEWYDAGVIGQPVEVRLPFMDLRVIQYLLAIPSLPWCRRKELLRRAGRGILPESVLHRPKTPLFLEPAMARIRAEKLVGVKDYTHLEFAPVLSRYVSLPELRLELEQPGVDYYHSMQVLLLNIWLKNANV